MLLFTGLPLFLMELSLGQYGAAGPITVWKCCPLLKGIGIGMLLVSSLVSLYYNVIISWTFYYLGMSFQSPLPWSCDAPQNAHLCQAQNVSLGNASRISASEAFWNEQVLGVVHSSGLGDPGPVRWPLALCLFLAWLLIFLCALRGIRSSGKVVYFTATFPYLVIVVLIIRGATLEGSIDGVRFYLSADWSRLHSAQVWNDAASQIFYSLGIGFGGLLSMASYNKFDNNVIRDTLVIAIGNCCTSFFAGFAIFSILGHMAWRKKVPVGEVADTGPGLAFVAYPEALALLPGSTFWSVLFFMMLFTLGIDTLFGNMEGITTAVIDEFPSLRDFKRKALFLAGLCFAFYLLGLLLVTEPGAVLYTGSQQNQTPGSMDVIGMSELVPPGAGKAFVALEALRAASSPAAWFVGSGLAALECEKDCLGAQAPQGREREKVVPPAEISPLWCKGRILLPEKEALLQNGGSRGGLAATLCSFICPPPIEEKGYANERLPVGADSSDRNGPSA
ncbi:sodium-dependent proline transporter-like [Sphaerodactylus townsendi]|uniref:sodium-dependent proline transporter-like n=1 Tax=Sphaerodactylus townsendi TaxID=933632 RepID=UPI00202761FB|nr:sodium-dependent proline transporter-like [Sphaerodactylus townsendi]